MNKFIFVTGGVCSSLGKGVTASSIGALLEARGFSVNMIKIDPYINVDAGTMSPYQHGEVYVTDDGAETDLDLGNYGRFTNSHLSKANSITTGQVYRAVIDRERSGHYLGRTVQVIPHITDEIKSRIRAVAEQRGEAHPPDIVIVEVGGTVGDIESIPFLESCRQLINELGRERALTVHVTLIPTVAGGEIKTKPSQHSVKELLQVGIQPDLLVCRADLPLAEAERRKLANFTNIEFEGIISAHDIAGSIYAIPLIFNEQGMDSFILRKLKLENHNHEIDLTAWRQVVDTMNHSEAIVNIAVVGKYMELADAYKSVWEALDHGGIANKARVKVVKIDASKLEAPDVDLSLLFKGINGILVPGGYGERGTKGMVSAARYARENKIPYFGICLGMQIMVIETARNLLAWADADSTEFSPDSEHAVISPLADQVDILLYGGTQRLGANESVLHEGSLIRTIYNAEVISERHRHRYEFSNKYRSEIEGAGLKITALTPDKSLVEAVEWQGHPWGLGVQSHPELKSKPLAPSPIFVSFIAACLKNK